MPIISDTVYKSDVSTDSQPAIQLPINENEYLSNGKTLVLASQYEQKVFCLNVGLGVAIVAALFLFVLYLKKINTFRELAIIKTFNRRQLLIF